MGISSPPQTLPTLPYRDNLDSLSLSRDMWGTSATDGVFYFTSGGSEIFGGDATYPATIGFPTNGTVPAINYSNSPLILSWFDYFAFEFRFFVPDFGQAGTSVFGIGLSSGGGTPCTTNLNTAQLRFARFGTNCSGTVSAGFFNVICGPVSNQVVFNTTTPFSVNTWYTGKIEYQKSPKMMLFYINDNPIISEVAIAPTNMPENVSMSVRMHGSLTIDPSPVIMQVEWLKFTYELTTNPREPV